MSAHEDKFSREYSVVETIQTKKTKKTSIVCNSKGEYFIAKRIQYMDDAQALNEAQISSAIKHPNIVGFHDMIIEKEHFYLIEEYCEEGDLGFHIRRQIRKKRTYFPESLVSKWLLQLLLAIEYLHDSKIMHRDIKPQNIFLTSQGNAKLGSFRLSKIFEEERSLASTAIGSPYYLAPECIEGQPYDNKIDIWAFGCVLYEICSLTPIFNSVSILEQANNILKGKTEQLPFCYSKNLNHILNRCLLRKPYQRPSAKDLLRSSYFLDSMKALVSQKEPINSIPSRIPIKKYKVHREKLLKCKSNQSPIRAGSRSKQKGKGRRNNEQFTLPHLLQIHSTKIEKKSIQKNAQIRSKQKSQMGKEKFASSSRERKAPSAEKYRESSKSQKKRQFMKTEKNEADISPVRISKLMPPPLLPKPQRKNIADTVAPMEKKINFFETSKKAELAEQLSKFNQNQQSVDSEKRIKSGLQRIFESLSSPIEDEDQFEFNFEDENLARLTMKKAESSDQLSMYQSKLQQLIEEINYKYCPNMESIQQKTIDFDSNSFADFSPKA